MTDLTTDPAVPLDPAAAARGVVVRPFTGADVAAAQDLSDQAFLRLDHERRRPGWPEPQPRTAAERAFWVARTQHLLESDAAGCWVAEDAAGEMVGFATSLRRDGTWVLSTFAVRAGLRGQGIGRRLMEASLTHSQGCLRGMLSASSDAGALRRYLVAGFNLHPKMFLTGTVDRSSLPLVEKVREGTPADTDLLDSLDRGTRGSGHGRDHGLLQRSWRLLVSDSTTGQGYAYVDQRGRLGLLAAGNRRTAGRLLWAVLADGPAETSVRNVTAENAWAVDVATTAGLLPDQEGYLALRGMKPPMPYVFDGTLL